MTLLKKFGDTYFFLGIRFSQKKVCVTKFRLFDLFFSLMVLAFGLPILIAVSFLIKLDSKGPVIFRQERAGKSGKKFMLLKFRTMREVKGQLITAAADKRITRPGRFLRRTKLDELPQFINVLKGDLSVVGPRPELPEIVKTYNREQEKILSFKPGITSPASIKFRHEEEILDSGRLLESYLKEVLPVKLKCDSDYFKNCSLWSDLIIIVKTIRSIFDVKN